MSGVIWRQTLELPYKKCKTKGLMDLLIAPRVHLLDMRHLLNSISEPAPQIELI